MPEYRLPEFDRALFASGNVRIPTLAEALGLTLRLDKLVNVEIKPTAGDTAALVEAVLLEIRATGTLDRVAVSSFDHDVVCRASFLEPGVATGALVLGPLDRPPGEFLESLGADALHAPADGLDRTFSSRRTLLIISEPEVNERVVGSCGQKHG